MKKYLLTPGPTELPWDAARVTAALGGCGSAVPTVEALIDALCARAQPGDQVIFMSNGGFEAAPRRFVQQLRQA